jgi:O-antigen/teichoic acid export membrane protein
MLPIILPVLAGDTFTPSIPAAQLLMVGAVTWLTFFWLRPTYRVTGRIKELFKIDSYVIAVTAILYPVASYYWGYLGLALLRPLRSFIFHGLSIWLLFRLGARI